ncbi:conserved protein of unknown function [Tenacibaculum sp. 190130A14a]|uniref:Polymerase/histidinol phosphatase N-terminal domain-containing protein n=1 Tax=Tenacibaculum polynesiense TaxID=3137857 RepID=A0ABM9PBR8_9FLAO
MTNKTRGSEWKQWDLHFHTPSSYDYKDKSVTNQDIVDGLINNNISVVAITDHNLIDVKRIKELQSLCKDKELTILPGIEFLSDARGSEPIHFIAIFSENCNLEYIWGQLKNNTELKKIEGENKKYNEVYCDLADTIKLIKELDGIVSIHAGSKSNGLEKLTHSLPHSLAQKEDIAKIVDVFELGKVSDIEGYNSKVNPYLKSKINKWLPTVICSDNHNIKDYKRKEKLWIKAEPTFEGLRQIIFEPIQRIRIQPNEPDFKEEKLIIDEVQYFSSDNLFTPEKIRFNKNLNVIIGGKSSGKSILLYNIASTLETNKEVTSIMDRKYDFRKDDENFNFEVKSLSGVSQKLYDEKESSIIPKIKYIPQNYLTKLAEPEANKKGEELLKYVRGLLLEDEAYKTNYQDFLSVVKSNDKKRNDLIDSYFETEESIKSKNKQLKEKGNEEVLKKSIETNLLKIAELKKGIGLNEKQIAEYNTEKLKLEKVESDRIKINSDYRKVSAFNRDILNTLKELKNKKDSIQNSLEMESIKELFTQNFNFLEVAISDLEAFSESIKIKDSVLVNDNLFRTLIIASEEEKRRLEKILEPLIKNEKVKKHITDIDKIITADKLKLEAINQLKVEIKNSKEELNKKRDNLFKLYVENSNEYPKIISTLNERTKLLEEQNLDIIGTQKFNVRKFIKTLYDICDGRKFPEKEYDILQKEDDLISFQNNTEFEEIKRIFDTIVNGSFPLNTKTNRKSAIKVILDDYFVDFWETVYDGDKMEEMSTGKASFVILMLIVGLSSSKAPILIDQPEDNLDNRSITKDLVKYLRDKKSERQIILVTHNPNVVVNADAENIIVANQKGQNDKETSSPYRFDYINGPLENTKELDPKEKDLLKSMGIREHIADIVEGGKEAFKKREVKYRF